MSSNIRVNSITPAVGNNVAIGTAGGTITFNCDTISGIATFANNIDITQTLDVDGHTELDNVNISGVVTATSFVGPLTGTADVATTVSLVDSSSASGFHYLTFSDSTTGNENMRTDTGLRYVPSTGELNIPNVTASSATLGSITCNGNVSIAGTLTYEDVTNVDSVGIITARTGIVVSAGHINLPTGYSLNWSDTHERIEQSDAKIKFFTNNTEKLTLSGSNLGIGTDNPTESKIVIGHTQTSTVKHLAIKDLTNNWVRKLGVDSSNNFGIFSGDTEHFRITGIGSIGISSTAPKTDVDISQKTGAVALPQGTTAQRPTGSAPYIRKNTTNNALEYFDGTSWVEIITDYFPTGSVIFS